ncbi:hypothetical protein TSUD_243850 [Trifolium subterraneum]|uniref:hAT-like transposase RNase-H fold domain-containing protein n=1 Tax=Trifolium subterraneum TaxID=3900 RepID=A0A2Z6PCI6_TRISU|nr:hypothetical protein TSUD_243850 [Trifolium subterraneum]
MDDIGIDIDNESTQNEILEVNGDGSQPPIAAVGDGFQPSNAIEATPAVEASLQHRHTKKTKPNANGPRKTAPACGKRYLCDPKSHGTTNLLAHSKICPKIPQILNGEHWHLRCCSRILNLIVRDGLKTNQLVISKIRTAVRFVRSSSQRLAKFKECVGFAGITCGKSLCLDVITRWKSTYLMLESAEPFQVAFDKLDFEDPSYLKYFGAGSCPPNFDDWDKARALMKFLKIFYDATKFFSTSTHVSIHDEFHHLFEIHNDLKLTIRDFDPVISAMGKEMILKYEKYWGIVMKDQNNQEDLDVSEKIDQLQAEIAKTHSENEAFVNVFGKQHGGFARSMGLGVTPSQLTTTCATKLTSSSEANEKIKQMQAEIDRLKDKASQVDILKEQVAFLMQKHNSKENQQRFGTVATTIATVVATVLKIVAKFSCNTKIVDVCESLASTSFGTGPSSAATPAVDPFAAGPSSQSRPFGRG